MSFYKFGKNDIFHNRIKAHPQVNFTIYDTKTYYNNNTAVSGAFTSNVTHVPVGSLSLYELNVDRPANSLAYPFVTKAGSLTSFKTVSLTNFNNDFAYGDEISGSYPLSARISIDRFVAGQSRPLIDALRNTLDFYKPLSSHYAYGNKGTQELKLISIPSIFYGSSIKKGTLGLNFYVSGTLAARLVDDKRNGELRQSLPVDSNSGSVAGVALYNEGFLILTGSWDIHPSHTEPYNIFEPMTASAPRWIDFGTTGSATPADGTNVPSSSFSIDLQGTQYTPVVTMLAHAPKSELNFSNNPTFVEFGQTGSLSPSTNSTEYKENTNIQIKNVVQSNFSSPTASFQKEVYISRIGIYDNDKNLIAVAKLSSPIRKREIDDFTIKLKMDF